MKSLILPLMLATFALGACAKPPGSITPLNVSSGDFDGLSCHQLATEISENRAKLDAAEDKQRAAVAADTAGVLLVLIPPTLFTGDAEDEVALYKGNDIALNRALNQNCGG